MKYILTIGYVCLITFISHSQVKNFSFYFEKNSEKISQVSQEDINDFDSISLTNNLQIIEINGFTEKGDSINSTEISQQRINYILKRFNLQDKQISINNLGVKHESVPFLIENWNRVDMYFFQGSIKSAQKDKSNDSDLSKKDNSLELIKKKNPINKTTPFNLSSVKFIEGTDKMHHGASVYLTVLKDTLLKNTKLIIEIRGHVCCAKKMRLSKKRAKAVYKYLLKEGVKKNRLSYKGYANFIPLVFPEITYKDREANRRVDVIFK